MSPTMELPATKRCTKCGEVKDVASFHKSNNAKSGRESSCKFCRRIMADAWVKGNPSKVKQYQNKYKASNSDRIKERRGISRDNNISEIRARDRDYKKRVRLDPEVREKHRLRTREWAEKNREYIRAKNSEYQKKNPGKCRGWVARYRARQKAMREFFKMHRAMHAIAETLNQMKP